MSNESVSINYFHPQAFLMFANTMKKGTVVGKLVPKPEESSVYKIVGKYEPTGVMSRVYNSKNSSGDSLIKANFFNLEPYKISALVPELRFFKVIGNKYVPFYMPISTLSADAASLSAPSRTGASMVKSFTVNYTGTDPYTAPKYLKADLQLYIDNLQNIFADPPEPGYARLADIFTISIAGKSNPKKGEGGSTINSGDLSRPIEVAATLGYSIINRDIFTQQEIEEILESNISLRMNVFSHTINVEQNGTATIDISYTARINNAGRDKMFSALDSPEDLLARADIKQLFKSEKEKAGKIKQIKKKDALERARKKQEKKLLECRRIMELLDQQRKIYSIKASKADIIQYANLGIERRLTDLAKAQAVKKRGVLGAISEIEGEPGEGADVMAELFGQKQSPDPPKDDLLRSAIDLAKKVDELDTSKREIYYVTFGDLLQAFMHKVKESLVNTLLLVNQANTDQGKKRLKQEGLGAFIDKSSDEKEKIKKSIIASMRKLPTFKVLLSDFTFKFNSGDQESKERVKRMNIADVPISLYLWQKFMFDTIINSDRNTYVIPQFLESCIRKGGLLDKALREWAEAGIAPNIITAFPEFTSSTFAGPQLRSSVFSQGRLSTSEIPSPQKAFTASNIDDESDYFLIYQQPTKELSSDKSGMKKDDSKRGIYHFEVGKNRGLFKSISFSRIDVPFVQEQLMTNQVGMYDELKMVYKANIEMVGNNLFFPGSQIFVDPGTIGFGNPRDRNSAAARLGLGGYYTVITVSTSINNGIAKTTLDCMHEAHATGRLENVLPDDPVKNVGAISQQSTSPDPESQGPVNLEVDNTPYYGLYYKELVELKDPETDDLIMDEGMARILSEDHRKIPSERPEKIKGVLSRQTDKKSGAVIYHLTNGKSVKIDNKWGSKAVSLVENSKTYPKK